MLRNFLRDEDGQGMVEYALIIALIAVVLIGVLKLIAEAIGDKFDVVQDELNKAGTDA